MDVCTQPVLFYAHTLRHTHAYSSQLMSRHIHLLQVFTMFLITCRNGPPVCDNRLPSLLRSVWLCTERDLSHVNWIFDGLRAFEILWDLLAFSSPSAFFHLKRKWIGLSISLSRPPGNHVIMWEILCALSLCSAKWVIEIMIECVAPLQGLSDMWEEQNMLLMTKYCRNVIKKERNIIFTLG